MEATTISTTEKLSASRWMVLAIIVLVQFQLQLVTFAPAAVASPIISNLQLTRTEFGLIMSALNITIMVCQVLGSVLVDRAGLKLGLFYGAALVGSVAGGARRSPSSLSEAVAMPVAWTLALGLFAVSLVYNMYFSFLPLFLESERGISLANANRLGSLFAFSGVAGVIAFGVLATRATWRKHLLCASCALLILGSIALFFGEGAITKAGLLVAGFGLSGFLPVVNTYIMSLPSMTPSLVAAFVVIL